MGRQLKDDLKGRGITSGVIALLVRAGTAAQVFTAITVVVPLTLWVAWRGHSTITEPIVLTLFCLSFVWASLSILRWQRCLRRMGWQSPSKLSFGLGAPRKTLTRPNSGEGECMFAIPFSRLSSAWPLL